MHYFMHPAFKFGNNEITGIWVAKFESSNDGNGNIKFIPNASSWNDLFVHEMFTYFQNMKNEFSVYGWISDEVDSHMMKNIEWGAVAYLSKSKYGADTQEIWNNAYYNDNIDYMTGCSGTGINASEESTCVTYETLNGQKASTTHNIYGVYDMSGGLWENVMGNYDNISRYSGFTDISLIDSKYIDRYTGVGSYDTTKYGDAVYETSRSFGALGWFDDYTGIFSSTRPWFGRGGGSFDFDNAGPFYFDSGEGNAVSHAGFRVVLVIS